MSEIQQLSRLVEVDGNTSGFIKDTEGWRIIGASAVAASITGTITETALATVTLLGGAMGANGILRITTNWTVINNANVKNARLRLGGIGGVAFLAVNCASNASLINQRLIMNRNSPASQISTQPATNSNSFTVSAGANLTGSIDTAVAQDIVISGELGNIADTITLESYLIELKYGA